MKAILFDLDGTLILNSMETFLPAYFSALVKKVGALVPADKFITQLKASTAAMIRNADPVRTNADIFAADFFPKIGLPPEQLMPVFDDFYAREYRDLRAYVQPVQTAREIVASALDRKHSVVIATNPLFPRTAIDQRLEWGKLNDFDYALVTDYETMHACKPNPQYYREIASRIGADPTECVMVGNDVEQDIAPARKVGMKTFWITDAAGLPTDVASDWRGTLEDFGVLLKSGKMDA